jgi:hypothetical protein
LNPLLGRPSQKLTADPPNPPAQQPNHPTSSTRKPNPYLSRCRARSTRHPPLTHPFLISSSSLCLAVGQPSRCARRATRWARQPSGPHAEGRSARIGCRIRPREGAKTLVPRTARIRGQNKRPPRDPPAPSRRTARGIGGNPPRAVCGLFSKGHQAGMARTPSHQPLWGFPLATAPACTGLKEGESAPPPRRARQGRSREPDRSRDIYPAGTPSTRQGRRLQPPLVKERRPSASGKGAGPEQGHLHRRECLLHHATARPRPGYDSTTAPT